MRNITCAYGLRNCAENHHGQDLASGPTCANNALLEKRERERNNGLLIPRQDLFFRKTDRSCQFVIPRQDQDDESLDEIVSDVLILDIRDGQKSLMDSVLKTKKNKNHISFR
jgi:hypothetical protein